MRCVRLETANVVHLPLDGDVAEAAQRQRGEYPEPPIKHREDVPVGEHDHGVRPFHCRRIRQAPMCGDGLARPDRARLVGRLVAESEDEVEMGPARGGELVPRLGPQSLRREGLMVTPAILIIPLVHLIGRRMEHPRVRSVLQTVIMASAALLLAASIPLARDGLTDLVTVVIASACLYMLFATRLDTLWIILGAATVSLSAAALGLVISIG